MLYIAKARENAFAVESARAASAGRAPQQNLFSDELSFSRLRRISSI